MRYRFWYRIFVCADKKSVPLAYIDIALYFAKSKYFKAAFEKKIIPRQKPQNNRFFLFKAGVSGFWASVWKNRRHTQ